jgi:tRNA-uridine 2-sulfurtransferase
MNHSYRPESRDTVNGKPVPRVVVAMSGGVDSSVAAALLVEQGYDVVGMMMRLWSEPGRGSAGPHNRCCTPDQMADARRVANILGIPFYVLDAQDYFRHHVVQFFIDEHAAGRTPNPCIECNRQVRFTYLYAQAMALGADYLATGHYARVKPSADGYQLQKAVDEAKDQSYVLHLLNQEQLAHVKFPVGDYPKEAVRQMAERFGLPVAQKGESMDLCFLGDGDYRRFLREHAPETAKPGPILTVSGENLGQHTGLPAYTIGQRKGLGVATGRPLFVVAKDIQRNALIVGSRVESGRLNLIVRKVNWVAGQPPAGPIQAQIKIRYRARPVSSEVTRIDRDTVQIAFHEPILGATPGQGAVFYQGEFCIGGGIIAGA